MELGTALALVAFADQCIKYGTKFVKRCKSYLHAEAELREMQVKIEQNWMKTKAQILFLKKIATDLDYEYLSMQSRILSELEGKLKTATMTVDNLIARQKKSVKDYDDQAMISRLQMMVINKGMKVRYSFKKQKLESVIADLEQWQSRFDPTWMLITRMENRAIDQELSEESEKPQSEQCSIIMTSKGLRDAAKRSVEDERTQSIWLDPAAIDVDIAEVLWPNFYTWKLEDIKQRVVIDTMHCLPVADVTRTTRDVAKLGHILSKVDPQIFGLLKCRGIVKGEETIEYLGKEKKLPTFSFVFDVSSDLQQPRSLRTLLLGEMPYPLNERFELARKLTRSILYVHSASFVHKNIRPETIIVFGDGSSDIAAPFLLGFEKFRTDDGQTYSVGDVDWEKNLYRYPTRQGILPEEAYKMQHDIYSLGIVLLEIGLWKSLVKYPGDVKDEANHNSTESTPVPNDDIASLIRGESDVSRSKAAQNKEALQNLARIQLPRMMGQKYTDVVLTCLSCLDEGEKSGFNDQSDYTDKDGLIIGERFIEHVLDRIQEISL